MKKIALITGATGFVGAHLADYLLDVVGLEVHGTKRPRSRLEFIKSNVIYHEVDMMDYTGISAIIKEVKPDYIFHLAAQSFVLLSWKSPQSTLMNNIIGNLNILEAVKNEYPEAIIQVAGSSEEYGQVLPDEIPIKESVPLIPVSPYGVSKVSQDLLSRQYCKSYGVKTVITRAFNHTGPGRGEVFATSSFAKQIAQIEKGKEPIIHVGNLEAIRDFTDVRDTVRAYWLAVNKCDYGDVYNICTGNGWAIGKMLEVLLSHSDVEIKVQQDKDRMRPSDLPVLIGDASKFIKMTGWKPEIEVSQTLADLLQYWRDKIQ